MNIEPNDLVLFARVVDEGSFSRAADRLGFPKSTVSRRVAALEAQLGEQLLRRTTRKLTVTDFGRAVLEHAHHVAEDVAAAESLAQHRQVQPSGRLRVTMPPDMASLVLAPMLAEFVLNYPAVTLELDLSSRFVDLIAENFDVAVRMGELRDDATLAARRLGSFASSLYAAPAYVARRGAPAEPEALMEHDALRLLARTGDPAVWTLVRGEARWEGIPPGRATANAPEILMRMALAGAGIAMIHDPFAAPYLERGELVPILPDWSTPAATASAVFPGRRLMPAHARAFVDTLVAKFGSKECQTLAREAKQIRAKAREKPPMSSTPAQRVVDAR